MRKLTVKSINPERGARGRLRTPEPCKYNCGESFDWPPAKSKHEKACKAAVAMANQLDAEKGSLHSELVEFLHEKRAPVVARLAEIDSMIRALGGT